MHLSSGIIKYFSIVTKITDKITQRLILLISKMQYTEQLVLFESISKNQHRFIL